MFASEHYCCRFLAALKMSHRARAKVRNIVNVVELFARDVRVGAMGATQRQPLEFPLLSDKSMKARQCSKIAELRWVLEQSGYRSLDRQAGALGLGRSTTWAILQASHKASGVSGCIIKRMLQSPGLPPAARQWIDEYVSEKLSGAYGHSTKRLKIFRAQVAVQEIRVLGEPPPARRLAP